MYHFFALTVSVLSIDPPTPKESSGWVGLLGVVLFFVLLFWAAAMLRKWAANRGTLPANALMQSKYMKLLDTMGLPGGGALMLLQVGQRILLVSTADKKTRLLAELEVDELTQFHAAAQGTQGDGILKQWISKWTDRQPQSSKKHPSQPTVQDSFAPLLSRLRAQDDGDPDALAQLQRRLDSRLQQQRHVTTPGEDTHSE